MKNRCSLFISVLLISLLQSACVSAVRSESGPAQTGSTLVVDTASGPTLQQILPRIHTERLIYIGETHTRNADHLLQLSVLRSLPAQRLALGVEWLQARFQPVLDAFNAGRISEAEMLHRTGYFNRWGFDYRLYRPIIRYAQAHHIPIIALNASRELTDAIHASGLDGLSPQLKKELPDSYDYSDKTYERLLKTIFEQHRRENASFERFREVQLTWDETMAQHIADYLKTHPGKHMLVLAGRGHIAGRHGIPQRVTRRVGIKGIILGSYDPDLPVRSQADYLILDQDQPLPPKGLMGALLDIGDGRIVIKDFTPGSAAKKAGLESGDRIVAVDHRPTDNFAEFKLLMLDKKPGDRVSISIIRSGFLGGETRKTFHFALKGAAPGSIHPHRK